MFKPDVKKGSCDYIGVYNSISSEYMLYVMMGKKENMLEMGRKQMTNRIWDRGKP